MQPPIFVDWLTASQKHPGGGLPVIIGGLSVWYDSQGNPRRERSSPASVAGSFDTSIRVGCDGSRVYVSGNPGRLSRSDNLFNFGWFGTVASVNRVLHDLGLPPFSVACGVPGSADFVAGARVHRLDVTANYSTGSDSQARALIRWLSARSLKRVKRGYSGDDSVWWSNTRHMLKAYRKGAEMVAHGASKDDPLVLWCQDNGIVRVEVELKRRLLGELGLDDFGAVSDEVLASVFVDQTSVLRSVDHSDEPDILGRIPARYRMTAGLWLSGQDVRAFFSRATLFRHARVLRGYGIDILEVRNVEKFPVRVRVIDLVPVAPPDWYSFEAA